MTPRRLRPAVAVLAATSAVALAIFASPALAGTTTVTIADAAYQPETVTINVGDSVNWVQSSKLLHTVTADDGTFASHDLGDLDSFGVVFDTPGVYSYHCKIHAMSGKIIVLRAGASPTAAASASPSAPSTPSAAASSAASPGLDPAASVAPSAVPSAADASTPGAASNGVSPAAIAGLIGIGLVALVLLLFVIPARRGPNGGAQG